MKKIICAIMAILMLSASAMAEGNFLFRDLPWGSSVYEVIETLGEVENIYVSVDVKKSISASKEFIVGVYFDSPISVAGHELKSVSLETVDCAIETTDEHDLRGRVTGLKDTLADPNYFEHDIKNFEESIVYTARYRFDIPNEEYEDLKRKLSMLYGETEELDASYYNVKRCDWRNDEGVIITIEQFGNWVTIEYSNIGLIDTLVNVAGL